MASLRERLELVAAGRCGEIKPLSRGDVREDARRVLRVVAAAQEAAECHHTGFGLCDHCRETIAAAVADIEEEPS